MELGNIELESKEGFNITLRALNEDHPIDDNLMEADLIAELIEQVESGELMYFCACISVSKAGVELGTSYLGCCFENNLEGFKTSGYLDQMIDEAMDEAKGILIELN